MGINQPKRLNFLRRALIIHLKYVLIPQENEQFSYFSAMRLYTYDRIHNGAVQERHEGTQTHTLTLTVPIWPVSLSVVALLLGSFGTSRLIEWLIFSARVVKKKDIETTNEHRRSSCRPVSSPLTKDHMIFDLIDLFNRNGFRLIKSNHSLTTDYRFLWKTCIISWILDEICAKFHPLLAILVIWARNHLLFELEINSKMRPSV